MGRGLPGRTLAGPILAALSASLAWSVAPGVAAAQSSPPREGRRPLETPDSTWARLEPAPIRVGDPAPPLPPAPSEVRALYLNVWQWGSERFWNHVRVAEETEINALILDVKDATGYVSYQSEVPVAVEIEAGTRRVRDPRDRLDALLARGIYPIARIVVAKDPVLAEGKPGWAIHDRRGGIWIDRFGDAWVDAFNDSVWIYAAELGTEAVRLGFSEVQFDYVRFPDEPAERLANTVFTARRGEESQRDAVRRGLAQMRSRIARAGVPLTLDVFGLTTSATDDLGIGQVWEDLVEFADVVLPMVYPSHYHRGAFGFKRPNSEPYEVVRRAVAAAVQRTNEAGSSARIRPFLQAFTLGPPRYDAHHIQEQIRAVEDLGIKSWALWNPGARYKWDALRPAPVRAEEVSRDST